MVLFVHNYFMKFLSFPHIQFTHFAVQSYQKLKNCKTLLLTNIDTIDELCLKF